MHAAGATVKWSAGGSGDWHTPGNWDTGVVPTVNDHALIDMAGTYTVTASAPVSVQCVTVGTGAAGTQTLTLTGEGHSLSTTAHTGACVLARAGGVMVLNQGPDTGADLAAAVNEVQAGGELKIRNSRITMTSPSVRLDVAGLLYCGEIHSTFLEGDKVAGYTGGGVINVYGTMRQLAHTYVYGLSINIMAGALLEIDNYYGMSAYNEVRAMLAAGAEARLLHDRASLFWGQGGRSGHADQPSFMDVYGNVTLATPATREVACRQCVIHREATFSSNVKRLYFHSSDAGLNISAGAVPEIIGTVTTFRLLHEPEYLRDNVLVDTFTLEQSSYLFLRTTFNVTNLLLGHGALIQHNIADYPRAAGDTEIHYVNVHNEVRAVTRTNYLYVRYGTGIRVINYGRIDAGLIYCGLDPGGYIDVMPGARLDVTDSTSAAYGAHADSGIHVHSGGELRLVPFSVHGSGGASDPMSHMMNLTTPALGVAFRLGITADQGSIIDPAFLEHFSLGYTTTLRSSYPASTLDLSELKVFGHPSELAFNGTIRARKFVLGYYTFLCGDQNIHAEVMSMMSSQVRRDCPSSGPPLADLPPMPADSGNIYISRRLVLEVSHTPTRFTDRTIHLLPGSVSEFRGGDILSFVRSHIIIYPNATLLLGSGYQFTMSGGGSLTNHGLLRIQVPSAKSFDLSTTTFVSNGTVEVVGDQDRVIIDATGSATISGVFPVDRVIMMGGTWHFEDGSHHTVDVLRVTLACITCSGCSFTAQNATLAKGACLDGAEVNVTDSLHVVGGVSNMHLRNGAALRALGPHALLQFSGSLFFSGADALLHFSPATSTVWEHGGAVTYGSITVDPEYGTTGCRVLNEGNLVFRDLSRLGTVDMQARFDSPGPVAVEPATGRAAVQLLGGGDIVVSPLLAGPRALTSLVYGSGQFRIDATSQFAPGYAHSGALVLGAAVYTMEGAGADVTFVLGPGPGVESLSVDRIAMVGHIRGVRVDSTASGGAASLALSVLGTGGASVVSTSHQSQTLAASFAFEGNIAVTVHGAVDWIRGLAVLGAGARWTLDVDSWLAVKGGSLAESGFGLSRVGGGTGTATGTELVEIRGNLTCVGPESPVAMLGAPAVLAPTARVVSPTSSLPSLASLSSSSSFSLSSDDPSLVSAVRDPRDLLSANRSYSLGWAAAVAGITPPAVALMRGGSIGTGRVGDHLSLGGPGATVTLDAGIALALQTLWLVDGVTLDATAAGSIATVRHLDMRRSGSAIATAPGQVLEIETLDVTGVARISGAEVAVTSRLRMHGARAVLILDAGAKLTIRAGAHIDALAMSIAIAGATGTFALDGDMVLSPHTRSVDLCTPFVAGAGRIRHTADVDAAVAAASTTSTVDPATDHTLPFPVVVTLCGPSAALGATTLSTSTVRRLRVRAPCTATIASRIPGTLALLAVDAGATLTGVSATSAPSLVPEAPPVSSQLRLQQIRSDAAAAIRNAHEASLGGVTFDLSVAAAAAAAAPVSTSPSSATLAPLEADLALHATTVAVSVPGSATDHRMHTVATVTALVVELGGDSSGGGRWRSPDPATSPAPPLPATETARLDGGVRVDALESLVASAFVIAGHAGDVATTAAGSSVPPVSHAHYSALISRGEAAFVGPGHKEIGFNATLEIHGHARVESGCLDLTVRGGLLAVKPSASLTVSASAPRFALVGASDDAAAVASTVVNEGAVWFDPAAGDAVRLAGLLWWQADVDTAFARVRGAGTLWIAQVTLVATRGLFDAHNAAAGGSIEYGTGVAGTVRVEGGSIRGSGNATISVVPTESVWRAGALAASGHAVIAVQRVGSAASSTAGASPAPITLAAGAKSLASLIATSIEVTAGAALHLVAATSDASAAATLANVDVTAAHVSLEPRDGWTASLFGASVTSSSSVVASGQGVVALSPPSGAGASAALPSPSSLRCSGSDCWIVVAGAVSLQGGPLRAASGAHTLAALGGTLGAGATFALEGVTPTPFIAGGGSVLPGQPASAPTISAWTDAASAPGSSTAAGRVSAGGGVAVTVGTDATMGGVDAGDPLARVTVAAGATLTITAYITVGQGAVLTIDGNLVVESGAVLHLGAGSTLAGSGAVTISRGASLIVSGPSAAQGSLQGGPATIAGSVAVTIAGTAISTAGAALALTSPSAMWALQTNGTWAITGGARVVNPPGGGGSARATITVLGRVTLSTCARTVALPVGTMGPDSSIGVAAGSLRLTAPGAVLDGPSSGRSYAGVVLHPPETGPAAVLSGVAVRADTLTIAGPVRLPGDLSLCSLIMLGGSISPSATVTRTIVSSEALFAEGAGAGGANLFALAGSASHSMMTSSYVTLRPAAAISVPFDDGVIAGTTDLVSTPFGDVDSLTAARGGPVTIGDACTVAVGGVGTVAGQVRIARPDPASGRPRGGTLEAVGSGARLRIAISAAGSSCSSGWSIRDALHAIARSGHPSGSLPPPTPIPTGTPRYAARAWAAHAALVAMGFDSLDPVREPRPSLVSLLPVAPGALSVAARLAPQVYIGGGASLECAHPAGRCEVALPVSCRGGSHLRARGGTLVLSRSVDLDGCDFADDPVDPAPGSLGAGLPGPAGSRGAWGGSAVVLARDESTSAGSVPQHQHFLGNHRPSASFTAAHPAAQAWEARLEVRAPTRVRTVAQYNAPMAHLTIDADLDFSGAADTALGGGGAGDGLEKDIPLRLPVQQIHWRGGSLRGSHGCAFDVLAGGLSYAGDELPHRTLDRRAIAASERVLSSLTLNVTSAAGRHVLIAGEPLRMNPGATLELAPGTVAMLVGDLSIRRPVLPGAPENGPPSPLYEPNFDHHAQRVAVDTFISSAVGRIHARGVLLTTQRAGAPGSFHGAPSVGAEIRVPADAVFAPEASGSTGSSSNGDENRASPISAGDTVILAGGSRLRGRYSARRLRLASGLNLLAGFPLVPGDAADPWGNRTGAGDDHQSSSPVPVPSLAVFTAGSGSVHCGRACRNPFFALRHVSLEMGRFSMISPGNGTRRAGYVPGPDGWGAAVTETVAATTVAWAPGLPGWDSGDVGWGPGDPLWHAAGTVAAGLSGTARVGSVETLLAAGPVFSPAVHTLNITSYMWDTQVTGSKAPLVRELALCAGAVRRISASQGVNMFRAVAVAYHAGATLISDPAAVTGQSFAAPGNVGGGVGPVSVNLLPGSAWLHTPTHAAAVARHGAHPFAISAGCEVDFRRGAPFLDGIVAIEPPRHLPALVLAEVVQTELAASVSVDELASYSTYYTYGLEFAGGTDTALFKHVYITRGQYHGALKVPSDGTMTIWCRSSMDLAGITIVNHGTLRIGMDIVYFTMRSRNWRTTEPGQTRIENRLGAFLELHNAQTFSVSGHYDATLINEGTVVLAAPRHTTTGRIFVYLDIQQHDSGRITNLRGTDVELWLMNGALLHADHDLEHIERANLIPGRIAIVFRGTFPRTIKRLTMGYNPTIVLPAGQSVVRVDRFEDMALTTSSVIGSCEGAQLVVRDMIMSRGRGALELTAVELVVEESLQWISAAGIYMGTGSGLHIASTAVTDIYTGHSYLYSHNRGTGTYKLEGVINLRMETGYYPVNRVYLQGPVNSTAEFRSVTSSIDAALGDAGVPAHAYFVGNDHEIGCASGHFGSAQVHITGSSSSRARITCPSFDDVVLSSYAMLPPGEFTIRSLVISTIYGVGILWGAGEIGPRRTHLRITGMLGSHAELGFRNMVLDVEPTALDVAAWAGVAFYHASVTIAPRVYLGLRFERVFGASLLDNLYATVGGGEVVFQNDVVLGAPVMLHTSALQQSAKYYAFTFEGRLSTNFTATALYRGLDPATLSPSDPHWPFFEPGQTVSKGLVYTYCTYRFAPGSSFAVDYPPESQAPNVKLSLYHGGHVENFQSTVETDDLGDPESLFTGAALGETQFMLQANVGTRKVAARLVGFHADGMRAYLDGVLEYDNWVDTANIRMRAGNVAARQFGGAPVPITVEVYSKGSNPGGAIFQLGLSSRCTRHWAPVSSAMFTDAGGTPAPLAVTYFSDTTLTTSVATSTIASPYYALGPTAVPDPLLAPGGWSARITGYIVLRCPDEEAAHDFPATVTWTGGAADGLWLTAGNWDAGRVPAPGDDVVIDIAGGASVALDDMARVHTLTLGLSAAGPLHTLTLGTSLSNLEITAGGSTVRTTGRVVISHSAAELQGAGSLAVEGGGQITITAGSLSHFNALTIDPTSTLKLSGATRADIHIVGANVTNMGAMLVAAGDGAPAGGDGVCGGPYLDYKTRVHNYGTIRMAHATEGTRLCMTEWYYHVGHAAVINYPGANLVVNVCASCYARMGPYLVQRGHVQIDQGTLRVMLAMDLTSEGTYAGATGHIQFERYEGPYGSVSYGVWYGDFSGLASLRIGRADQASWVNGICVGKIIGAPVTESYHLRTWSLVSDADPAIRGGITVPVGSVWTHARDPAAVGQPLVLFSAEDVIIEGTFVAAHSALSITRGGHVIVRGVYEQITPDNAALGHSSRLTVEAGGVATLTERNIAVGATSQHYNIHGLLRFNLTLNAPSATAIRHDAYLFLRPGGRVDIIGAPGPAVGGAGVDLEINGGAILFPGTLGFTGDRTTLVFTTRESVVMAGAPLHAVRVHSGAELFFTPAADGSAVTYDLDDGLMVDGATLAAYHNSDGGPGVFLNLPASTGPLMPRFMANFTGAAHDYLFRIGLRVRSRLFVESTNSLRMAYASALDVPEGSELHLMGSTIEQHAYKSAWINLNGTLVVHASSTATPGAPDRYAFDAVIVAGPNADIIYADPWAALDVHAGLDLRAVVDPGAAVRFVTRDPATAADPEALATCIKDGAVVLPRTVCHVPHLWIAGFRATSVTLTCDDPGGSSIGRLVIEHGMIEALPASSGPTFGRRQRVRIANTTASTDYCGFAAGEFVVEGPGSLFELGPAGRLFFAGSGQLVIGDGGTLLARHDANTGSHPSSALQFMGAVVVANGGTLLFEPTPDMSVVPYTLVIGLPLLIEPGSNVSWPVHPNVVIDFDMSMTVEDPWFRFVEDPSAPVQTVRFSTSERIFIATGDSWEDHEVPDAAEEAGSATTTVPATPGGTELLHLSVLEGVTFSASTIMRVNTLSMLIGLRHVRVVDGWVSLEDSLIQLHGRHGTCDVTVRGILSSYDQAFDNHGELCINLGGAPSLVKSMITGIHTHRGAVTKVTGGSNLPSCLPAEAVSIVPGGEAAISTGVVAPRTDSICAIALACWHRSTSCVWVNEGTFVLDPAQESVVSLGGLMLVSLGNASVQVPEDPGHAVPGASGVVAGLPQRVPRSIDIGAPAHHDKGKVQAGMIFFGGSSLTMPASETVVLTSPDIPTERTAIHVSDTSAYVALGPSHVGPRTAINVTAGVLRIASGVPGPSVAGEEAHPVVGDLLLGARSVLEARVGPATASPNSADAINITHSAHVSRGAALRLSPLQATPFALSPPQQRALLNPVGLLNVSADDYDPSIGGGAAATTTAVVFSRVAAPGGPVPALSDLSCLAGAYDPATGAVLASCAPPPTPPPITVSATATSVWEDSPPAPIPAIVITDNSGGAVSGVTFDITALHGDVAVLVGGVPTLPSFVATASAVSSPGSMGAAACGTEVSSLLTVAEANALLGNMTYAPHPNYAGADIVAVTVTAGTGASAYTTSGSIAIAVQGINDAPTLTEAATTTSPPPPQQPQCTEDVPCMLSAAGAPLQVRDIDAGEGADSRMRVDVACTSSPAVASATGITVDIGIPLGADVEATGGWSGLPSATVAVTVGSPLRAEELLALASVYGGPDFHGGINCDVSVSDLGHTGAGGVLVAGPVARSLTYAAVNDRPSVAYPAPTGGGGGAVPIVLPGPTPASDAPGATPAPVTPGVGAVAVPAGSMPQVQDVDDVLTPGMGVQCIVSSPMSSISVPLTGAAAVALPPGVSLNPSAPAGTVIFEGPLAAVSAALGLIHIAGVVNDVITITVNDLGNHGSGGTYTATGTVPVTVAGTDPVVYADPDTGAISCTVTAGADPATVTAWAHDPTRPEVRVNDTITAVLEYTPGPSGLHGITAHIEFVALRPADAAAVLPPLPTSQPPTVDILSSSVSQIPLGALFPLSAPGSPGVVVDTELDGDTERDTMIVPVGLVDAAAGGKLRATATAKVTASSAMPMMGSPGPASGTSGTSTPSSPAAVSAAPSQSVGVVVPVCRVTFVNKTVVARAEGDPPVEVLSETPPPSASVRTFVPASATGIVDVAVVVSGIGLFNISAETELAEVSVAGLPCLVVAGSGNVTVRNATAAASAGTGSASAGGAADPALQVFLVTGAPLPPGLERWTSFACVVSARGPGAAPVQGPVVVRTILGAESSTADLAPPLYFSFGDAAAVGPQVIAVTPPAGPVTGGDFVTVIGSGFGAPLAGVMGAGANASATSNGTSSGPGVIAAPSVLFSSSTPSATAAAATTTTTTAAAVARPCALVRHVSDSSIECTTPAWPEGPQPVDVSVTVGFSSVAGTKLVGGFNYIATVPTITAATPIASPRAGNVVVTLHGAQFGDASSSPVAIALGPVPCTLSVHVSTTLALCTVPAISVPVAAGYLEGDPLPFTLTRDDGGRSEPSDLGFAYHALLSVRAVARPVSSDLALSPDSAARTLPSWLASRVAIDEDGERLADVVVSLDARTSPPSSAVTVTLTLNDTTECALSATTVTVPAGGGSELRVEVKGLADDSRDGSVPVNVAVTIASADPAYASLGLAPLRLVNLDSAPRIARASPPTFAMIGGQIATVTGTHMDPFIDVSIAGIESENITVTAAAATGAPAGAATSRSGSVTPLQSSSSPSSFSVTTPTVNKTGYVRLTVSNRLPGGGSTSNDLLMFFTDDCPVEGQYGTGLDCAPCPTGGYCPGGNRVWPLPGYWNPSEDSEFVVACNPAEACQGCVLGSAGEETLRPGCWDDVGSECEVGYTGRACAQCDFGFTRAFGQCVLCPDPDSQLLNLILDAAMWLLYAVAATLVRDRENLSHIVMLIIAVQEVGAVGQIGSSELPGWLRRVYDVFYLFSGDISFVKPDCLGRLDYELEFFLSVAYVLILGIPVLFGILFTRALSGVWNRRHGDDFVAARHAHYTDRLVRALTIHVSIIYFVVTLKSFQEIACYPDPDGMHLIPQPDRVCFVGLHIATFAISAVFLLVFTIGWPVYYIRRMRRADREGVLFEGLTFVRRWDFLYEQFHPKYRYLFLAEQTIAVMVAVMTSFAANHPIRQMFGIGTPVLAFIILICAVRPYRRTFENVSVVCLMTANLLAVVIGSLLDADKLTTSSLDALVFTMVGFLAIAFTIILGVNFYFLVWTWTADDDATRHAREMGELKGRRGEDGIEFDGVFDGDLDIDRLRVAVADAAAPAPAWLGEERAKRLGGGGPGGGPGAASGGGGQEGSSSEDKWYNPLFRLFGIEDDDQAPGAGGGPIVAGSDPAGAAAGAGENSLAEPMELCEEDDGDDADARGVLAAAGIAAGAAGLASTTLAAEARGASRTGRKIVPVVQVPSFVRPPVHETAGGSLADRIVAWGASLMPHADLPPGWSSYEDGVRVVDVTASMLGEVQRAVDATCKTELLGAGRDASVSGHTRLRVTAVRRVENVFLHRAYRSAVELELSAFRHANRPLPDIAAATRQPALDPLHAGLGVSTDRGELLLFHGTNPAIADIICQNGFDARVSRQGLLGTGVYFGDASSKADEYAGDNSTSGTMILARVWIGDPYVALASQSHFRRPPCVVGHSSEVCAHPRFTSVVAVTNEDHTSALLTKHREYVVYEKAFTCPELIIEYQREGGGAGNGGEKEG